MRKLTFNTSVKQLQRTSNVVFTDYDATVASISAALTF
jgi:hypothetical protein